MVVQDFVLHGVLSFSDEVEGNGAGDEK